MKFFIAAKPLGRLVSWLNQKVGYLRLMWDALSHDLTGMRGVRVGSVRRYGNFREYTLDLAWRQIDIDLNWPNFKPSRSTQVTS